MKHPKDHAEPTRPPKSGIWYETRLKLGPSIAFRMRIPRKMTSSQNPTHSHPRINKPKDGTNASSPVPGERTELIEAQPRAMVVASAPPQPRNPTRQYLKEQYIAGEISEREFERKTESLMNNHSLENNVESGDYASTDIENRS